MRLPPHRVAEERSLALHRAVAARLREHPGLVDQARRRVDGWLASGVVARPYAEAWARLLRAPLGELFALLEDPGERACALRQVSPFAGVLNARTRWHVLRTTGRPRVA